LACYLGSEIWICVSCKALSLVKQRIFLHGKDRLLWMSKFVFHYLRLTTVTWIAFDRKDILLFEVNWDVTAILVTTVWYLFVQFQFNHVCNEFCTKRQDFCSRHSNSVLPWISLDIGFVCPAELIKIPLFIYYASGILSRWSELV